MEYFKYISYSLNILIVTYLVVIYKKNFISDYLEKNLSFLSQFNDMVKNNAFVFHMTTGALFLFSLMIYSYQSSDIPKADLSIFKSVCFELSKIGLSSIFVTILLSIKRFVPFVEKALGKIFTEKEYLSTLKDEELHNLVETINSSTGSVYEITNNARKKASIEKAREQAIKLGLPYFLTESKTTKAMYDGGLEMTVSSNKIEMLKDGYFESTYTIETNKKTGDFPDIVNFLTNTDRFSQHVLRSKIIDYSKNGSGVDPTGFELFELDLENIGEYEEKIIKEFVPDNREGYKRIIFKTNGPLKAGDTFTHEIVASVPNERVKGSKKPELRFGKPAGVRVLVIQGQHFVSDGVEGTKGGTLTIGGADSKATCVPTEDIFYKKYTWTLYYDEVSEYANQNVVLTLL